MITDEERAEAAARFQAQLDALPPPDEARVSRIATLFASIILRKARDTARAQPPPSHPETHQMPHTSDLGGSATSGSFAADSRHVMSAGNGGQVEPVWRPCGDQVKDAGREPDTSSSQPPGQAAR